MSEVTFLETMTVGQFKDEVAASQLNLVQNPKNGKYFIADEAGNSVAAVTKKVTSGSDLTDPVVSHVRGNDGKEFYIMHNKGNGGNDPERSW